MRYVVHHEVEQMLSRMKFLCIISGCSEGVRKWHIILIFYAKA